MIDDDDEPETLEQLDGPLDGTESVAAPSAHRRRQERIRAEEQQIVDFWRAVMADPVGRRVLWVFLAFDCHAFETKFACGPSGFPQPEATWFQAGQQQVGDRLYKTLLKHCRESVAVMHDEHDPDFAKPRRRRMKNG